LIGPGGLLICLIDGMGFLSIQAANEDAWPKTHPFFLGFKLKEKKGKPPNTHNLEKDKD